MNSAEYYLLKYIPDLHRFEPRNVGVILWSHEGVAARFLAERPDRSGEVDGRSVPSFIASTSAYKQWIMYWRKALRANCAIPVQGGSAVARSAPEFLKTLATANQGNYHLAPGGLLLDPVISDNLEEITSQLFDSLVISGIAEEQRDPTLDEIVDEIIEDTRLSTDANFCNSYEVSCQFSQGLEERFEFSHAYKNGSPKALLQRVPFSSRKRQTRKTVDATAWMFEKVAGARIVEPRNLVALVALTVEQMAETETLQRLAVLGSVGRVLNVLERDAARLEFERLPTLPADAC
ncbi:MAG: hypothetical protein NTX50_11055 [Candidatus Sumerlaeota bacterium]|nr:hypothetical protein [Candidatus Sumerlaeota bacterium]